MTLLSQKTYPIWHPNTQKRLEEDPIKVLSAKGSYLTLEDGKKVLDMTCSWWVTLHGHSHPFIAKAIARQAKTLEQVLFANFTHDPAIELSKKLLHHLPKNLSKVFFSDNGSTAIEVAIKMAYQYWLNLGEKKRTRFLCFENAYHGDTVGAMSASSRSIFSQQFDPLLFPVDRAPFPAIFEGDCEIEQSEKKALKAIQTLFHQHKNQYAAVLLEPLIQGAGGMRMCRPQFLQALEKIAKEENTLIIYDEVFVGFGRTGDWFACIKAKTSPNIICLSKGITGGFLPLSVTICSEDIYQAFYQNDPAKTFFHGHSYTANPLGCSAGIASLELLEKKPQVFQNMEKIHRQCSRSLQRHPRVKNLRFCGTIAAFDLEVQEAGYLNLIGTKLRKYCLTQGLYIRPLGNTVYIMPPYCTSKKELSSTYTILENALNDLFD